MDLEPIIVIIALDKLCLPEAYPKLLLLQSDIVVEPVH